MGSIEVKELARCLAESDSSVQLIDVREPEEIEIACLPNFTVLSLSKFNEWSATIHDRFDVGAETLVLCHHGIRSAQMCQWLETQGFTNVKNISGGIDAYSISIDGSIPRY